jgi:hypothetical protein
MGKVGLRVYISRLDYSRGIQLSHVPEQRYFIVKPGSPVIELTSATSMGASCGRGRLYFFTGTGFDTEFLRWSDRVLRRVRSVLIKDSALGPYYYGPAAKDWVVKTGAHERIGWNELVAGTA